MTRLSRLLTVTLSLGLSLVAVARSAHATPGFPAVVADTLRLTNTPPCALCHDGGRTGLGTVQTPFGISIRAHGAAARDDDALRDALLAMDADRTSSLHDGVADTTKLRKGLDPNGGDPSAYSAEPPAYGCGGARLARLDDVETTLPWVSLALVAWIARRRRQGANCATKTSK